MWAETLGQVREVSLELGVWRGGLLKGVEEGSPWSYFPFLPPSWGPVRVQGHAACGLGSKA